jgi:GTP cyclohydrolase I
MKNDNSDVILKLVRQVLEESGDDPNRDGLLETPKRVAKAYKELLSGYHEDPTKLVKLFDSQGFHDLVTVSNIKFHSLCEHHILPFFGRVNIGYVPNGKVLGLSKFARIVEVYSRRLQTQENLSRQIFELIWKNVKPLGLIVSVEASHLCVSMRGVKNVGFITKTVIKDGVLKTNPDILNQFYKDIKSE